MKEHETTRLPPITYDNMPKSVEQQMLAALESIDAKLSKLCAIAMLEGEAAVVLKEDGTRMDVTDVVTNITPVETPFSKQPAKNAPQEPRKHRR